MSHATGWEQLWSHLPMQAFSTYINGSAGASNAAKSETCPSFCSACSANHPACAWVSCGRWSNATHLECVLGVHGHTIWRTSHSCGPPEGSPVLQRGARQIHPPKEQGAVRSACQGGQGQTTKAVGWNTGSGAAIATCVVECVTEGYRPCCRSLGPL